MSDRPLLAIRADGGPGIGAGHLVRSLALAQAWIRRRGDAVLVSDRVPTFWRQQLDQVGCVVAGASGGPADADWWVIDGYDLGGARCAPPGARVLLVDDADGAHTGGAGATIVLDQNLGTGPDTYPAARCLLLGPRYALLREEVLPAPSRHDRAPSRLLLMFGGAPTAEVQQLATVVARHPLLRDLEIRLLDGASDAPAAMRWADLAVAAAGTSSWELCCAGVPAVLVPVAGNQEPVASALAAAGAAVRASPDPDAIADAVNALRRDDDRRRALRERGQALVDGLGARRAACVLRSHLLDLRPVTMEDAGTLLEWANDPMTRAASFSPTPIELDDHLRWLRQRTASGEPTYIASDGRGDLGVVRFDGIGGQLEVGLTVAPRRRGEGWAGSLVYAGCARVRVDHGTSGVVARVKPSNTASSRAFEDADFDAVTSEDPTVLRYARRLDG